MSDSVFGLKPFELNSLPYHDGEPIKKLEKQLYEVPGFSSKIIQSLQTQLGKSNRAKLFVGKLSWMPQNFIAILNISQYVHLLHLISHQLLFTKRDHGYRNVPNAKPVLKLIHSYRTSAISVLDTHNDHSFKQYFGDEHHGRLASIYKNWRKSNSLWPIVNQFAHCLAFTTHIKSLNFQGCLVLTSKAANLLKFTLDLNDRLNQIDFLYKNPQRGNLNKTIDADWKFLSACYPSLYKRYIDHIYKSN